MTPVAQTGHSAQPEKDEIMSEWKQPEPTKAFAIYFDGAWYGQGDTPEAAWANAKRQTNAGYCRYGATLYAKICRRGACKRVVDVNSAA